MDKDKWAFSEILDFLRNCREKAARLWKRTWARMDARIRRHWPGMLVAALLVAMVFGCGMAALGLALWDRPDVTVEPVAGGIQSIYVPPSGRAPTGVLDGIGASAGFGAGNYYFVSTTGSDANRCTSWDRACLTAQHVISEHVVSGNGDTVFVAPGLYDGAITINKSRMSLIGMEPTATFQNATDTSNGSSVIEVVSNTVTLRGFSVFKNDFSSLGSYGVLITGTGTVFVENILIAVPPVPAGPHTGIWVNGGDGVVIDDVLITGIAVPFGNGIVFHNTVRSGIQGKTSIGRLGTGIRFQGTTDEIDVKSSVSVFASTTCVQWGAGVTSNVVEATLSNCGTEVQDGSGNATNAYTGLTQLKAAMGHAGEMRPGTQWVIDGERGNDASEGMAPLTAFATISKALSVAQPGDSIHIRADGVYTENITISTNAIQVFAAQGVVISGTDALSPAILVTGDNVWFRAPVTVRSAGVGICVDANDARIEDMVVEVATTAFDLVGDNTILRNTRATGYSAAGYALSGLRPDVQEAHAGGAGGATTGYIISSTVDSGLFVNLSSVGNGTLAYDIKESASNNIFISSVAGTGDGVLTGATWSDPNLTNMRVGYDDQSDYWHHEEVWPLTPGDGTATDLIGIASTNSEDTWGQSFIVMDVGAVTESWSLAGVFISAGTANKNMAFQFFIPQPQYSATRNGGRAWAATETDLTTDGDEQFAVGDVAWVRGSVFNEVVTVTAITGTTEVQVTALAFTHAGNPEIYLVERPASQVWSYRGFFSDSSAKGSKTLGFHDLRQVQPGGGVVGRLQNLDDNIATSIEVGLIYER